jgi:hypothetical protein
MSLLFTLRKNGAARRYARKLPAALRKGWGRSASYTPGQIQAAVRSVKLDPKYIVFGYAAFLSKEAFAEVYADAPPPIPREAARKTFVRFVTFGLGAWNPASESGEGGWSGDYYDGNSYSGGHHGGHGGGEGGHH